MIVPRLRRSSVATPYLRHLNVACSDLKHKHTMCVNDTMTSIWCRTIFFAQACLFKQQQTSPCRSSFQQHRIGSTTTFSRTPHNTLMTVSQLKAKLEPITGIPASSQLFAQRLSTHMGFIGRRKHASLRLTLRLETRLRNRSPRRPPKARTTNP